MKRASYREAIQWIADNEDTEFVSDAEEASWDDGEYTLDNTVPSVTLCLVMDLFDVELHKAVTDLKKALDKAKPRECRCGKHKAGECIACLNN